MTGSRSRQVAAGAARSTGLVVSSLLLGVSFGTQAVAGGWSGVEAVLASSVIFSASAQFALLAAAVGPGAFVAGLAAASLALLRWVPMSLALAPSLSRVRWRGLLQVQALVDGSFVLADRRDGTFDVLRLIGATLAQWPAWIAGTAIGVVLSPDLAAVGRLGLDAVAPAFFAVLLMPVLRGSREALVPAAAAAFAAACSLLVAPPGVAILAAAAAAMLGLRKARDRS